MCNYIWSRCEVKDRSEALYFHIQVCVGVLRESDCASACGRVFFCERELSMCG